MVETGCPCPATEILSEQPGRWKAGTSKQPREPHEIRDGTVYGCPNFETREEAVCAANAHLAQLTWTPADGFETGIALDRSQRADFRSWAEFQLRFREARARGLNETDAHAFASRDPARPELWTEGA